MSLLLVLLIVWSIITAALIVVVIYRSVISLHEDDQLFLDRAEAGLEREQQEVQARLKATTPYLKYLGVASGVLAVALVGMWVYQGLSMQP